MAIANSDGSIILSTKVDTSGMEQGTKNLKSQAAKLAAEYRKAGMSQSEALKKARSEIERTRKETEKATKSTQTYGEKAKTAFQGVGSALKSLAGYLAIAFSVTKIIQFGNEAINLASDLQEVQNVVDTAFGNMAYKIEKFSKTAIEQFGLSELAAKQWASTMMAMGSGMGQSMEIGSDMAVELTGRLADVMSFYNKTEEEAFTLGKAIYSGETEPLKSIGIIMTENNLSLFAMSKGYKQAYKDMDAANKLLVRQQFFLEKTSLAAGDYTKTADGWANQTRTLTQRWKEMQSVFGETIIAFGVIVLPVINTIIDGLKQIAIMLKIAAKSFGLVKEETNTTLEKQAEKTEETAKSQEKVTDNIKDTNKELKKTLAGFDDIQILSAQTAQNTQPTETEFDKITTTGDGNIIPDGSAYADEINETLAAIMQTVAVSMIAIGLILLFTGNVGWGIGAIISGLGLESVSVATITETDPSVEITNSLLALQGVAVGASVALGIMMIFMGSKGLGVGLIVYGAAQLGVAIYEISQFDVSPIESTINTIQGVAAGAMLALGFFLLYFKVNMPLAISLIAGGALLVVDEIFDIVEGGVKPEISAWINGIMLILEGASVVIGIILLMTKVNIPLGITLLATGAATLTKEAATDVKWDGVFKSIKTAFESVVDWIAKYGTLAVGILLVMSGISAPLGFALIADGAGSLGTGQASIPGSFIFNIIKQTWEEIKRYWNENIDYIWTFKFWFDLAKIAGNGLIAGFEGIINGIIKAFETMINWIVDSLNKISFDVPDWVPLIGGQKFGFDISRANFGRLTIPRLAQGAVIPPNREFLAVLGDQRQGTNIEAPLATMVEAFQMALDSRGGYNGGNTEVVLEIDGRELGRAVVEQGNRENRRIGTRLVIV